MKPRANADKKPNRLPACAVLLAGGRGTRFWPRSRTRTPKQLLNIVGNADDAARDCWRASRRFSRRATSGSSRTLSNPRSVKRELPEIPRSHVLAEPAGRNTAAAIGLAALHLVHEHGDALMAVLPSDSYIADAARYRRLVQRGARAGPHARESGGSRHSTYAPGDRLRLYRAWRPSRRARAASRHTPSGASPKSRRCPSPGNTFPRENIFGTQECFSGALPRSSTI